MPTPVTRWAIQDHWPSRPLYRLPNSEVRFKGAPPVYRRGRASDRLSQGLFHRASVPLPARARVEGPGPRQRPEGGGGMPLFMDVHRQMPEGATASDVAEAHAKDVATQDQYGVKYMKYWVDDAAGKIFCLVEAPDAETAATVHREAHGLVADEIYQVQEGD